MSKTFGCESECPPIEKFIWNKVAKYCGYFEGVKEVSIEELFQLRGLIDFEMVKRWNEIRDPNYE